MRFRMMKRTLLALCGLLMLVFSVLWCVARWGGTLEPWERRVSPELTLDGWIRSDALVLGCVHQYELRVGEQEPPDLLVNGILFRCSRWCPTIIEASGWSYPGGTGVYPLVFWELAIPYWSGLLVSALYPLWSTYRGPIRRWRHGRRGCCRKCGYDLTGNVSGVCPECGRAVAAQRPAVNHQH
jgi:hypothetical protein